MIGGGTGPATGTNATTCTPGAWNMARMLEAVENFPDELRLPRQRKRFGLRPRWKNRLPPAPAV